MIRKLWKRDLHRNKIITVSLFIFILLSALLCASSVSLFSKLASSTTSFFQHSAVPDFVQMHAGVFDQQEIDDFVFQHKDIVEAQQTVTLQNIHGSAIYFNQKRNSEENSVMDIAFVKQNPQFDYLINQEDEVVQLHPGEVAVPIFYQQRDHLQKNDMLYIQCNGTWKEYRIVDFIKDVQMNASIISSKRILVHETDYNDLAKYAQPEYLIEFLSNDAAALEINYQSSGLPHNGTTITKGLLTILNSLMDGILAIILFAISLLLMGIAFLCLRFTILMTLEEDVKEIGVMKAIGIAKADIQKLYMSKYIVLTCLGCGCGFIASFFLQSLIFKNIQLYMGLGSVTIWNYLLPFLASAMVGFCIVGFCHLILKKMHRITPLQALRNDLFHATNKHFPSITLRRHGKMPVSLFISLQDIIHRKRLYVSVFFVMMLSSFLLLVPYHLQSTLQSKDFVRYMGISNSDLRMDVFFDETSVITNANIEQSLTSDSAVDTFSIYTTYQLDMMNQDGEWENIQVETGDFKKFPLTYINGDAPIQENEIAISYAIANAQDLHVGDQMQLQKQDEQITMKVCGIYQDITNGGKSAKVNRKLYGVPVLRSTMNVNFKEGTDITLKQSEFTSQFTGVKVTDTQEYVAQTMSGLLQQVHQIVIISLMVACVITIFQISLFLKMLLKKDEQETTILHCIGFTNEQLQMQYMMRMFIVACLGIAFGTLLANIGGAYILSLCLKGMGVAQLTFTIQPFIAYGILPLLLLSCVGIATIIATRKIGKLHIADLTIE